MKLVFIFGFAQEDNIEHNFNRLIQESFFLGQKYPDKKLDVKIDEKLEQIRLNIDI